MQLNVLFWVEAQVYAITEPSMQNHFKTLILHLLREGSPLVLNVDDELEKIIITEYEIKR
jgi:hypothetical protein